MPSLALHGHVGMGPGFVIVFAVIALVVLLAIAAGVVNTVVLLKPEAKPPGFAVWTVVSICSGLLTVAGGFVLHPNAPYDKNWAFLLGGLLLLAITIAARYRVRALTNAPHDEPSN